VIRPSDTPPGYAMFRHLRDFFETTQYWLLEPADALVSEGYCLATPGKQYVVFQNTAQPFRLTVSDGDLDIVCTAWHNEQLLPAGRNDTISMKGNQ